MASGDDACDAALAAWAAACLGESDGPPRTLEDLAEGPPLLSLARRFVRGAEAALPSDAAALSRPPRDSRVEVARHINDVYRDEHGRAARIVDVRWAGRSDTRAARALLLGVLLAAFQGPQAQEAAARIGALPQGHQGALAAAMHGVLARVASDAEADDAAGAVQPLGAEAPDGVPGAGPRRPSHASGGGGSPRGGPLEERRPSGQVGGGPGGSACSALWASRRGSFAGGAQEELEELSEALEDGRSRCRSERQASLHLVREIYAAKERLHHEADACHELQDEFESLRQEARDTESSVQYLREEVHEETRAASRHARKHGLAQQKVELLQKECKACDSECCELREQLAFTESGEKAAPKLSWSIVQRTKLKSMTDHQVEMDARLAHVNFVCSEEHMNVQRLAPSLEEARERLREFDSEAAKERARLHEAEALIGSAEVQEEVHRRNMRRLAGASTDELLGELVLLRDEEQQALRQAGLEEASARALQDAVEEARAAARCAVAPDHESEPDFSDYAPYRDHPGGAPGLPRGRRGRGSGAARGGARGRALPRGGLAAGGRRGGVAVARRHAPAPPGGPGAGGADPAAGAGAPPPVAARGAGRDPPRQGDAPRLVGAAPAGAPVGAAARQVRGPAGGGGARGADGRRRGVVAGGAPQGARRARGAVGLSLPRGGGLCGRCCLPRCESQTQGSRASPTSSSRPAGASRPPWRRSRPPRCGGACCASTRTRGAAPARASTSGRRPSRQASAPAPGAAAAAAAVVAAAARAAAAEAEARGAAAGPPRNCPCFEGGAAQGSSGAEEVLSGCNCYSLLSFPFGFSHCCALQLAPWTRAGSFPSLYRLTPPPPPASAYVAPAPGSDWQRAGPPKRRRVLLAVGTDVQPWRRPDGTCRLRPPP
ncbi:unnamed protein product [Prorocentrum cordatum]|uniref:Uncharacterized protein n=1 Tax=Prorocentrum cordatum TaxID=2364126 RepID=A0ABN9UN80_9DINO|nr:unnamed protein product [Polarella glacialis]